MSKEIWKPVVGYENSYHVSNKGNVKGIFRKTKYKHTEINRFEKELKKRINKQGYFSVMLYKDSKPKSLRINRLVAIAFIENPFNKPYVNHLNGIKQDNRVSNLEWCTASENKLHAFRTGLNKTKKGSNHHNAKLSPYKIKRIRSLKESLSCNVLAKMYGVSKKTILNVIHNKTYKTNEIK